MIKSFLILALLVVAIHGGDGCPSPGNSAFLGGSPAPLDRYPYHVSVRFEGLHACGGVLISRRWVLTIIACAARRVGFVDRVTVVMGTFSTIGEELQIKNIVLEKDEGALALMELEEESSEQFVKLNRKSKVEGLKLTLAGFGRDAAFQSFFCRLQEISGLPVKNEQSCVRKLPAKQRSSLLCVGDVTRACFGDEGAPLILPDPRNTSDPALDKLIGLAIFPTGADECGEDKPGVYVNVAKSGKWISSVIN